MATVKLLETRGLCKSFGGLRAVRDVDFTLERGEVRAVIGPNGAGKTTFVNLLSGGLRATSGTVLLNGEDVTRMAAWRRVRRGIAYTFQVTSIYAALSVYENVAIAAQAARRASGGASFERRVRADLERVGLRDLSQEKAGTLAYGHQRLLEIAMGLALEPAVLILDEPTQGLSDAEIASFCGLVESIAARATVLLIEHNMSVVMSLADRITVMDRGAILAEGDPRAVRGDQAVQDAYLAPFA